MARDNHYGPRFEEVQKAFPNATRFHWHVNAYTHEKHWMVATPSLCADGAHTLNIWRNVQLEDLDGLLQ